SSSGDTSNCSRLAWLQRTFRLSAFDVDVILIALAPELDLRYERLYAYFQDDVTRKRPSIDLALNLLCSTAAEKIARRAHFGSGPPLMRHGLLRVIADTTYVEPPLLAHYLKLDEQIIGLLTGSESLTTRLAPFCQLIHPNVSLSELPLPNETKVALPKL